MTKQGERTMSTSTTRNTGSRWDLLAILVAGIAVFSLALTGCGETEAQSGAESTVAPRTAAMTTDVPGPPTLEELQATLELTAEQSAALSVPLSEWQDAAAARQAGRAERRSQRQRGQGHADGGAHTERRAARMSEGGESPMLTFVTESATVLEHDQYVQLITYLGERRDAHRESFDPSDRGGGQGRGHGRGKAGMGMMRALDLTTDQRDQLHDAMGPMRESGREAREAHANGTISAEALRDRMSEARQAMESALNTILTDEQLARRQELMTERHQKMSERKLEHQEDRVSSRVERLTELLQLTDDQQAGLRDALAGFEPRSRALITALGNGEMAPEEAHYEMTKIREETTTAIRALLTPEQIEIFDALETLKPGPGAGPGRRGPRF